MNTSSISIFLCQAFVFYSIAITSYFFPKSQKFASIFTIIAFVQHTIALWFFYDAIKTLPSSNIYGLVEIMGWGCAVVSLVGIALKIDALKKFPLLASAILTVIPLCCPVFTNNVSTSETPSSLTIQLHALFAGLSYAMMFAGFVLAIAYLRKSSNLKNKIEQNSKNIISLESLNKAVKKTILLASITMLISIILGVIGMPSGETEYPLLIKIIIGLSVFSVQIYITTNIILENIKATSLAKITTILLVLSIVALFPIELRRFFI
ncbi:MAG: hypothetical protein E7035_09290 [Verrucomicrobiaceae bacterium]|nr:hypothetical protein [Verrucomicrobiaceae bacterium]